MLSMWSYKNQEAVFIYVLFCNLWSSALYLLEYLT